MKYLHVITSLRTGGAEKLMVDLLPRLRDLGNEVDLCVFDGVRTPFFEQLEESGIKIKSFGINCNVYNPLFIFKLVPIILRYDVIHTHNTACQFFVAMANQIAHKVIITTEHSTSNRRREHRLLKSLDRWLYRQYQTIVTVSDIAGQNIKDYVNDHGLPTVTIANGIDVQKFNTAKPCSEFDSICPGCYKGVMVAGFRYEKDQTTVIKAYSLLPENYHLFLVGDGEKRSIYESLISSLGLSGRVHLMGVRSDVHNILRASDVVIMSSHREGLSLSNLEGMASGRPFIASDVDGLHEIVNGYGILFPHEDAEALAAAIKMACEDLGFAAQISNQCVQRAMKFDISVMAEKYNQVYHYCSEK